MTAYIYTEPRFINPPTLTSAPRLAAPQNGAITVSYSLDRGTHEDQSLVSWSICDDAACAIRRAVAVSRGNQPMKTLSLLPGFAGKFVRVAVQPKIEISEAGPAVYAVSPAPAIGSSDVSLNFRNLITEPNEATTPGLWTVMGPWTVADEPEFVNGYGARSGNGPAYLFYREDGARGDMQVDLVMIPEKTAGQGFSIPGSPSETGPRSLHSDVYIKYDARTRNGYALRFWRTTLSSSQCMFQIYKIVDGVGSPIDDQQMLSGVFRPKVRMTLRVRGNQLTVDASNTENPETLHLEGTIIPNSFGGTGVFWPGGSANVYSRMGVVYPPIKRVKD